MKIRIVGFDPPGRYCGPGPDFPDGHRNIHVAVQGRRGQSDLFGLVPGDEQAPAWELDCAIVRSLPETDLRGPQIHGSPGKRFIYLSWGVLDDPGFQMFRRAKIWLDSVPPSVLAEAIERGELAGRVGLTDDDGWPVCASIRPPRITWSATSVR